MKSTRTRFAIVGLLILFLSRDVVLTFLGWQVPINAGAVSASGVGLVGNPPSLIITCSADGKTLHRWQVDPQAPLKEPRYLGKTDAILSE